MAAVGDYLTAYGAAQNAPFIQRVELAMLSSAVDIQSEVNTTTNHTNRANYAKLVLNSPNQYSQKFAEAILAHDLTIDIVTISDVNLKNAVSAVWNALAGTI